MASKQQQQPARPAASQIKAPSLLQGFNQKQARVIGTIRANTLYIQEDKDNEKVKNRIHDTDLFIKEHKEYLKQQGDKVK